MDPLIPSICQQQEISAAPCLKELFFNEVWRVKIPQHGMTRYVNWTEEMAYGRAVPLGHKMANFADPDWGNCRFDTNTLRKGRGYKHALIKNYTTRWNNVLRHDILAILENQHVAMSWDGYQLRSSLGTTMHGLVMIPVHTTTVPDPTKKRYSIREEDYRRSSRHATPGFFRLFSHRGMFGCINVLEPPRSPT